MSDVQIKRIDEVEAYSGAGAREGIKFRAVGRALGVSAWGMNAIEMAPGTATYPEHDHAEDGQEEVFFVARGSAILQTDEGERQVGSGEMVRVGPREKRKWIAGDSGVTLLAMGGTPGKAYEPR